MKAAQKIYEMLLKMPEERVLQVFNLVVELQNFESEIQPRLDFRKAAGLGQDFWQSVDVEEYIKQERASWD